MTYFKGSLIIFLLLFFEPIKSQSLVTISGRAVDNADEKLPLTKLMFINKRTNLGEFANADCSFTILARQSDTILFSAVGYMIKKICLKDSVLKKQYSIIVQMQKLQYTLKEISVFATRELSDIQKDINKLGVQHDYKLTTVNAFSSPISALYERFGNIPKQQYKVAQWENEDMKRNILKDLFHLYIQHDIIDLSNEDFDAFIKYLNLSDEFIQSATQFELTVAIKGKYESFKYRWK